MKYNPPLEWWLKTFYRKYLLYSVANTCHLQLQLNSPCLAQCCSVTTWNRSIWNLFSPSLSNYSLMYRPHSLWWLFLVSFSMTRHARIIHLKILLFLFFWSTTVHIFHVDLAIIDLININVFPQHSGHPSTYVLEKKRGGEDLFLICVILCCSTFQINK